MGPGQYQNGALWDWWAGWQVLGEFESGDADLARAHLAQIAADWATHPGQVFEWQTLADNAGHGPADYAGAAATVGESVIAGLFGVTLDAGHAALRPRLGDQPGFIRVYQPANGHYAAYRYTPRADDIYVDYGSDAIAVSVAVLLPPGRDLREARLDDRPVAVDLQALGPDRYARLDAPAGLHRLVLMLR